MADLEKQLKDRAKELKILFRKGLKVVGSACKKGWYKVRKLRG